MVKQLFGLGSEKNCTEPVEFYCESDLSTAFTWDSFNITQIFKLLEGGVHFFGSRVTM